MILLQFQENWLYDDGAYAAKKVYVEKLNEMRAMPARFEMRRDAEQQRPAGALSHCVLLVRRISGAATLLLKRPFLCLLPCSLPATIREDRGLPYFCEFF